MIASKNMCLSEGAAEVFPVSKRAGIIVVNRRIY